MATNAERNYGGVDAIMIALNLDVLILRRATDDPHCPPRAARRLMARTAGENAQPGRGRP
jgi:hypothetical protein